MGNSIPSPQDEHHHDENERRSQSNTADKSEVQESAEKLVQDIEDSYKAASDFYSTFLCLLCFYNNMCCLAWMICIGVICCAVFLAVGIVYLVADAGVCGTSSLKWGFCVTSLCIYSISLLFGSYNPPVGHLTIAIAFLIYASYVMFGPEQACLGSSLHTWFTLQYVGLFLATAFFAYVFYMTSDSFGTLWIPRKYQNAIDAANEVINGNNDEKETLIDTP